MSLLSVFLATPLQFSRGFITYLSHSYWHKLELLQQGSNVYSHSKVNSYELHDKYRQRAELGDRTYWIWPDCNGP